MRMSAPERTLWIGVSVDLALEVAQQQIVAIAARDRIGRQLDLAAAARRIDHEQRRGITCGVAAQRPDDLKPLVHPGAEMRRAPDGIALIKIIGLDAVLE